MKNKRDSGTALFLMEMIAVVCFFILCASVCILVFVRANNLSSLARDTNQASLAAESVAEIWKAEAEDGLAARFHMSRDGDTGVIYWDSQWNVTEEEILTGYAAIVNLETKEHTEEAQIQILRSEDKTELFLLTVKRIPDR